MHRGGDAYIKLLFYTNQQPKRQINESQHLITNYKIYFFMIIMMIIPTPILIILMISAVPCPTPRAQLEIQKVELPFSAFILMAQ